MSKRPTDQARSVQEVEGILREPTTRGTADLRPDSLLYEIFVLGQAVRRMLDAAMADGPLRPEEYAVYSVVFEPEIDHPDRHGRRALDATDHGHGLDRADGATRSCPSQAASDRRSGLARHVDRRRPAGPPRGERPIRGRLSGFCRSVADARDGSTTRAHDAARRGHTGVERGAARGPHPFTFALTGRSSGGAGPGGG